MLPPVRSMFVPHALADAIGAIYEGDATTAIKIGFVLGAPAWFYVGGNRDATVTLPLARATARRGTVALMADETSDEIREERGEVERISDLMGYRAALLEYAGQLQVTGIAIGNLHIEGDDLMSTAAVLAEAAERVRTSSAAVKTAIDEAIARLSDNPTSTDIQAAVDKLNEANAANESAAASAGTIDPADTSGGVVDDGSGGVVEAPPA